MFLQYYISTLQRSRSLLSRDIYLKEFQFKKLLHINDDILEILILTFNIKF